MLVEVKKKIKKTHSKLDSLDILQEFLTKPNQFKACELFHCVENVFVTIRSLNEVHQDFLKQNIQSFNQEKFLEIFKQKISLKENQEQYFASFYIYMGSLNGQQILNRHAPQLKSIQMSKHQWHQFKDLLEKYAINNDLDFHKIAKYSEQIMQEVFEHMKLISAKEVK